MKDRNRANETVPNDPSGAPQTRRGWTILIQRFPWVFPVLAGSVVRFLNFWKPSLWTDELHTYWSILPPSFSAFLARVSDYSASPPLYFCLPRWSCQLLGASEFALRIPSVLAGITSIYLVYSLGRVVLPRRGAVLAAWVFAFHPLFIHQSQEARPYSVAVLLALLCSLMLLRVMGSCSIMNISGYAACSAGLICTQFIFVPFVVFQSVLWAAAIIKSGRSTSINALKKWMSAQLLILVLTLPLFSQLLSLWGRRGGLQFRLGADFPSVLSILQPDIVWLFSLVFSFTCIGIVSLLFHHKNPAYSLAPLDPITKIYLAAWYLIPWPIYLGWWLLTGSDSLLLARYFIVYIIPSSLFFGWALDSLCAARLRAAWIVIFLGANFVLNLAPKYHDHGVFALDHGDDWRAVIRYLERETRPGTLIFLKSSLIETAWIHNSGNDDPEWQEYLQCPFAGFYSNRKWDIVNLPWDGSGPKWDTFLRNTIDPKLGTRQEFWLIVRSDYGSKTLVEAFQGRFAAIWNFTHPVGNNDFPNFQLLQCLRR